MEKNAEERGSSRTVLPIEKIGENTVEMKEAGEPVSQLIPYPLDESKQMVGCSTSGGFGARSPRTDVAHHWQVMATSVNLASDDEDFDSTQHLAEYMESMKLQQHGEGAGTLGDIDELENCVTINADELRKAPSDELVFSWLTTVGPLKNKDSDPKDLQRVVDFGQMQQVEEVSVMEGTAPGFLHKTLGEINQKRQSLRAMVRTASRSLTLTSSLPRDIRGWAPSAKSSAASVLQKGSTMLRNSTNRLFRHRKNTETYFTCQEAAERFENDALSEYVPSVCGEPATASGGNENVEGKEGNISTSEQNSEENKKSKLQCLKRQIFRKVFKQSKESSV